MVTCDTCGTLNQPGANFCVTCGSRLAVPCSVCGRQNPPDARFCSNCGSALPASPQEDHPAGVHSMPAPVVAEPQAERRLVTVLFADLVGFTTLAQDRDPEETRELLTRYFEVARRVVEGHGGTIEKFIGDAVMAVWGAPSAHEDDAERAVRAALELVDAVSGIRDNDQPLQARAGVLTGEAAVTIGAQGQGMVAGDIVNTASRLQSVAQPGWVLVGETTYRAAANGVAFEPAGERELKGKSAPVAAWRATAVVARRGGFGRSAAIEPPFVGRQDELRQLKDLFEATRLERKPRLVSVIGQAGIGKSRLAWEFEKYLDGVVETVYWHEGRTPAYGEGVSYWALAEMVRRRAGIAETDDGPTVSERLAAMLEEFVTDPGERRWIEPRLAGLLGAELPAEGREELVAAWRTLFERIADRAPTVMVFTDLQWADEGLLDFVEDLLVWARSSPIFVVALARPELLERRPDWGGSVRTVTRINLEPLPDGVMHDLLAGLLPGLPELALQRIVARAEGIPLYAVETVRMLFDTGRVVMEGDRYQVRGDLTHLAVAETLHALIAARLDANRPEDRALLQDAAVLGQSFPLAALAAVSGGDTTTLTAQIERLVRRQLLVQDTDPRSPERGQYRFIQSLVREIAYASLAREDRRARHLAAARYFEALGEDELAGILANHYLDASRASRPGPEADALAAQARVSLQAAAERAIALHSYRQAIAYLEQALTVTTEPTERAPIDERIARSGESAGEMAKGIEHARQALDAYRGLGDAAGALRAATWLARLQIMTQREAEGTATLEAAIEETNAQGEMPDLGAAYAELARAHMLAERFEASVAAADRALATPRASTWAVVEALVTKGTSLVVIGRDTEAEATLRGAIHLADREGLVATSLRARNNLSGPLSYVDIGEAYTVVREGYDMSARLGHRVFLYQFLYVLLETAWRLGDWDVWTAERDDAEESGSPVPFYRSAFEAGRALRLGIRGDLAGAEQALERSIDAVADLQTAQVETAPRLTRAWLRLIQGRWSEAVTEGEAAAVNSNFTVEGAFVAAVAAAAGNLLDRLEVALSAFAAPPYPGPTTQNLAQVIRFALEARRGQTHAADGEHAGVAAARTALLDSGDLLYGHLSGLVWAGLSGGRMPDAAAAGREAEEFFFARGAGSFVERFTRAFVPPEVTAVHAAPDPAQTAPDRATAEA